MDPMEAIRETFYQECDEQLGELETGLLAMQNETADRETVNAVFRAVHSIKGGAGAFKLDRLVAFAHTFESALDLIRNDQLTPTPDVLKSMLRAADVLADLVKAARTNATADDANARHVLAELMALTETEAPRAAPPAAAASDESENFGFQPVMLNLGIADLDLSPSPEQISQFLISITPSADLYRKGNEVTRLLRQLEHLGTISVTCDGSDLPGLSELDPEGAHLSWRIELTTTHDRSAIEEIFEFVEGDCILDIQPVASLAAPASASDHHDVDAGTAVAPVIARDEDPDPTAAHEQAVAQDGSNTAATSHQVARAAAEPVKADAAAAAGPAASTIRVDLDRIDRLINLVGELVINQAMLSQRVIEAGVAMRSSVGAGLDELEQLTREIQESVMAIRAQPVKPLFQRMARIVREVADATGKSVRLRTEGEATEVDRTVIERLADPLTHMIRNAVGHGLESPEIRLAAGKPATGEVRLTAAHRSGRIAIEISDDGGGIDRPRVKSIAIKKGLIPANAQLSDSEIDNLLFLPGFSTAESVSNISGRGVGMDVVKRAIQSLGGRISISSRAGQGSTFSLSLPLTLAVLDGMIVKVAEQTLVVPLTAIVETLKPSQSEVHGLGADAWVLANRGKFVPLIDIGRALQYRTMRADPLSGVALLVETEGGARSALMVDAIQDQRQVVIKSLETNYGEVPGVAAATILGDGRIALILDVDAVVANSALSNADIRTPVFEEI